jgi:glucoamylase
VWAHAEYLKMLRSARDGKVFDRVDPVYQRYSEPRGRKGLHRNLEFYSLRRPIQTMATGETLRILDDKPFHVTWTADGWATQQVTPSRNAGYAGSAADIPSSGGGQLEWTLRWTETGAWLGYNVVVRVE